MQGIIMWLSFLVLGSGQRVRQAQWVLSLIRPASSAHENIVQGSQARCHKVIGGKTSSQLELSFQVGLATPRYSTPSVRHLRPFSSSWQIEIACANQLRSGAGAGLTRNLTQSFAEIAAAVRRKSRRRTDGPFKQSKSAVPAATRMSPPLLELANPPRDFLSLATSLHV